MRIPTIISGLLLLASSSAHALDVGVEVKAGTVGFGAELSVALTQTISARVVVANVDIDDENETFDVGDNDEGEIDAELGFDFGANALLLDWYVFDGSFHLTAGMLKNNGKIDLTGTLTGSNVELGGVIINPGDIGDVEGSISAGEDYEPYVGFGWGRKTGGAGFSFSVDVGVALMDPESELSATVTGTSLLSQAEVDDAMQAAQDDIDSELEDLEAWPVISIGLNYAF